MSETELWRNLYLRFIVISSEDKLEKEDLPYTVSPLSFDGLIYD